jgi:hypothetical protein
MGCGWVLEDTDFSRVQSIEVVNAGFVDLPRGQAHISFWHDRLNQGHQITGIGGSDSHLADREAGSPSAIGNPTTWIYADSLSVAGIIDGIRRGNVFIEVASGTARLTRFSANGQDMGSTLELDDGELEFIIGWQADEDLTVRFIHMGDEIEPADQQLRRDGTRAVFEDGQLGSPGWVRFDLVDKAGATVLLGNPIYLRSSD